ncbi:MAG: LPS-assembly protein [Pseudomonadota bacterium]|nr:LPS-assembly protein [Pseudomonadota bacterium]
MLKWHDFNTRLARTLCGEPTKKAFSPLMFCARSTSLVLFAFCSLASLASGEVAAQGMTPLRVDPVLLGLPPVEKKAPVPAKPAEPPAAERARAEVKPVEAQAVETKALTTESESVAAPAPSKTKSAETPRPAKASSPEQTPARAIAPAEVVPSAAAAPSPAPAPTQSARPVVATPAPAPAAKPVAAAPIPVPVPSGGKVTTLEPLRVHPGLLGLPVVAGTPAPVAGGARAPSSAVATYAVPATMAGLDKGRNDAWRAGRPPVLNFDSDATELPDGAAPALALRKDKTLEPLQTGGAPMPMFLTADELSGVTDHEAVAKGDAEARRAGTVVNADRMTYWPVEDELEATGNVRLEKGDDRVTGPRMRMKMADQTGVFDQPEFYLKRESTFAAAERKKQEKGAKGSAVVAAAGAIPSQKLQMSRPEEGSLMNVLGISSEEPAPLPLTESYGSAERIDFEGENKLRLIKSNYTTCKPGDPGWYLKADELALDYDRSVGEGKNTTLYFQNTPIFYSPWLSFSLNNERKSGFLTPTFGSSSVNGLSLSMPYYWNIAPNMDATISPRIYAKRGLQVASEYRYRDYNYQGDVRAEYLPNDKLSDGDNRYGYSLRHQQNLGYGFSGALNLAGVSDDQYFTDLSSRSVLTSQRQLLRQGTLNYGGEWWGATVIGQSYQTLNPDADPAQRIEKPYSLAPQINVNARRPDFYRTDIAFLGQYSSFTHDTLDQGRRTVAYPQVSLPFVQPGWYVTPKVGAHVTSYSLDRRTSTGSESFSRSLPIFSVDGGMTFERDTTWFGAKATQTLEPRLYYLSVPYKDQSQIPIFDSALADFNFAQIFSENQFSGYDRISDANQLTAAVTTRLIDPSSGAEAMRAMFGQRYYFQRQRVTLTGQIDPTVEEDKWNKSDFLAAFSGRVLPKTYLDTALQYNPKETRMERSSIGARYQPELGKVLNVSYRYGSEQVSGAEFKNVDIAGQWPIWGGWSAVGRYNYSVLDHKPIETVGGLEYGAGCWAVRLVGHQIVTTSGREHTTFFVQLELNDFARIGSNPIDLLRRNVQGYGLANQPVADPVFGE